MKTNRFAMAIWVTAAVYFIGKIVVFVVLFDDYGRALEAGYSMSGNHSAIPAVVTALKQVVNMERASEALLSAILGSAELAALGAIIQLIANVMSTQKAHA